MTADELLIYAENKEFSQSNLDNLSSSTASFSATLEDGVAAFSLKIESLMHTTSHDYCCQHSSRPHVAKKPSLTATNNHHQSFWWIERKSDDKRNNKYIIIVSSGPESYSWVLKLENSLTKSKLRFSWTFSNFQSLSLFFIFLRPSKHFSSRWRSTTLSNTPQGLKSENGRTQ